MCEAGIAIDIGTTTVAAAAFQLKTGKFLFSEGAENPQRRAGSDVMARISFAVSKDKKNAEKNLLFLKNEIVSCVETLCRNLFEKVSFSFISDRAGRARISKIVITGNTTMLSLFLGLDVSGLAVFPFKSPSDFGFTKSGSEFFKSDFLKNAEVFFPPAPSAFFGSDAFCSVAACFFKEGGFGIKSDCGIQNSDGGICDCNADIVPGTNNAATNSNAGSAKNGATGFASNNAATTDFNSATSNGFNGAASSLFNKNVFICDAGTNCEMAVWSPRLKKIFTTSSAAGPAFEAQGIECGMSSSCGAVEKVLFDGDRAKLSVIGGGEPCGICGSGLLSAVSAFYKKEIISTDGTFLENAACTKTAACTDSSCGTFLENASGMINATYTKTDAGMINAADVKTAAFKANPVALSGGKFFLSEKVYLSQNDIRNFQLAKSAVRTGLEVLCRAVAGVGDTGKNAVAGATSEIALVSDNAGGTRENSVLFLCGGFGSHLNVKDALVTGMIPDLFGKNGERAFNMGNTALYGASLFLTDGTLDGSICKKICGLFKDSEYINLSEYEGFQDLFIKNLGLPD